MKVRPSECQNKWLDTFTFKGMPGLRYCYLH